MAGVTIEEVQRAQRTYASLTAVRYNNKKTHVTAATVTLPGIIGCGSDEEVKYRVIFELKNFPKEIPIVWIGQPKDEDIRHMNMFPAEPCPLFKDTLLPYMCTGALEEAWAGIPKDMRNILAFVAVIHSQLNMENPRSPARDC